MSFDNRLNPDDLLKSIKTDDRLHRQGGQLRLFLGMSAGVGKTFAMLRNAHEQLREGVDVVIGLVETHGRHDTAQLLEGLPLVPRRKVEHRGTTLEEMDIDAILKRKPALVIVDELAHTNAPNSRHEKRYQDVLELLDAGINVYSAMNVQHLESRKDAVEAITGVRIHETVPDILLDRASLVEIVDIAPSQLLKRLKEGKVYLQERAEKAAQNFFKEDKLTALREIALRITAERVDHDLQRMSTTRQDRPWATNERLLVAISHSPFSENLIRATRRLAYNLEAPWIVVYVDTGVVLSDQDLAQLNKNLQLARDMSAAEVLTTTDANFPMAIQRICRQKNVTQVVVGRPTRSWFRNFLEGGSLLENLIQQTSEVDIHIIRQDELHKAKPSLGYELALYKSKTPPIYYVYTLLLVAFIALISTFFLNEMGYRAIGFLFLMAVMVIGVFGSIGAVILAASVSAFVWNFFFIPPQFTFAIDKAEDIILIGTYFLVALITGTLTYRIRLQETLLREKEERTHFLYEILKDITNSYEKSEFLEKVLGRINTVLKAECAVILRSQDGMLQFEKSSLDEKKQAVALWSYQNVKPAGWSTDTLSETQELYMPLKGSFETVGVFVFKPLKTSRKLKLDQENLLRSIVDQLGLSVEKHFMSKKLIEAQRLKDSEHLHQTLLNTISHEMRTPLTAIRGSASLLEDDQILQDQANLKTVVGDLKEASDRLNHVVENLLDMSRLNAGHFKLSIEWHDLNDLVVEIKRKFSKTLLGHQFKVSIAEQAELVQIDFRLFEHAISNLILNSCYYTQADSEICFESTLQDSHIQIVVSDNGGGIAPEAVKKIFDKFYRVPGSPSGGTGLGLSIVKSIVELHQGSVRYEPNDGGGSRFIILLPYKKPEGSVDV